MTPQRTFVALILAGAAVALALRLPSLNDRPMHGDEAVHTIKFEQLWQSGEYVYDKHDYHGPTLYYFTLPVVWLSGANSLAETSETMFRLVPVMFGAGLILVLLLIGDGLGRPAAVGAGVLTAVSPAMAYYSRYYIQETLLVFFALVLLAAGWRYFRTRKIGWAVLAGLCAGLMQATKETCIIVLAAMAVALILTKWWESDAESPGIKTYLKPGACISAVTAALIVSALCFSVLLRRPQGIADSWLAYFSYLQRADGAGLHVHPWYYYLQTLLYTHYSPGPRFSEAMIVLLAAVGGVAAITGRVPAGSHRGLLRFLVMYTVFMVVVFSVIPYKTPWSMLPFLHGMILLAGVGAAALYGWLKPVSIRFALIALLLLGTIHLGRQARAASFRYDSDNRNPYAYAHPLRSVKQAANWVKQNASVHPDGMAMLVKVIAPDPWPLPWYLRGLERVGYWEEIPDDPDAPVIIAYADLGPELDRKLKESYDTYRYGLRPGVHLLVYVQRQDDIKDRP